MVGCAAKGRFVGVSYMARRLRCVFARMNDRFVRFASLAVLAVASAACSSETSASSDASGAAQAPSSQPSQGQGQGQDTSAEAQRAISEADIIQIDEQLGRLYAMSKSGTLAVVDVSR